MNAETLNILALLAISAGVIYLYWRLHKLDKREDVRAVVIRENLYTLKGENTGSTTYLENLSKEITKRQDLMGQEITNLDETLTTVTGVLHKEIAALDRDKQKESTA